MWNKTGMRSEKNYMVYITANCVCELREKGWEEAIKNVERVTINYERKG